MLQAARNANQLMNGQCPWALLQLARASHAHGLTDAAKEALAEARTRMPGEGEERTELFEELEAAERAILGKKD